MLVAQGPLKVYQSRIPIVTQKAPEFVDLTEALTEQVATTGIQEGYLFAFSRHTTAGVVLSQAEPLLQRDQGRFLENFASPHDQYEHDNFEIRTVNLGEDEGVNGHSHCQGLFVGCSVHVPISGGRLALGGRQRIFLVELDCARSRQVTAQIVGIDPSIQA